MAALAELERLRALRVCLLVPALEPGFDRAVFVAGGRVVSARSLPRGGGRALEVEAGVAAAAAGAPSLAPEDADELLVVASFLRRPPRSELGRKSLAARSEGRGRRERTPRGCASGRVSDCASEELPAGVPSEVDAQAKTATTGFADRVAEAVERKRSQLVVGLDPRVDLLPVELRGEAVLGRPAAAAAVTRFCKGIVDAVAPYVVAVKPQAAFFEALGSDGIASLEEVSLYARQAGLLVLFDGKRGDIGSTARAYAAAYLEPRAGLPPLADAITVNPYLGADSVEPFLLACRRYGAGIFLLVRTSNAGAMDIQDLALSDGRPLWHHVAVLVQEWGADLVGEHGTSSVGAVVGATYPRAVGEARRAMPQAILLLPGVGAQGATPADVARAFTSGPASALVAASRSVIYAYRGADTADWREASGSAAARLAAEVWAAAGW